MCNCNTDTTIFKLKLIEAREKSTTRKPYGVYFEKFKGRGSFPFVESIRRITSNDKICCYFLNDGTKVDK